MANTLKELHQRIKNGNEDAHFELAKHYFDKENFGEAEKHFLAYKNYLYSKNDEDKNHEYLSILSLYLAKIYLSDEFADYFRAGYFLNEYRYYLKIQDVDTCEVNDLIKKHFENLQSLPSTRKRYSVSDKKSTQNETLGLTEIKALLGDIYFEEDNYKQALEFCQESKTCATSKFNLGQIYYYGSEDIQKNYKFSKEYLLQCKEKYPYANLILGYIYWEGDSDNKIKQNFNLAIQYFLKVQKDYYEANYALGCIYSDQEGFINKDRAVELFENCLKMTDADEHKAEVHYKIGKLYQADNENLNNNKDNFLEHMQQAVKYKNIEACKELIDYYKNQNDEFNQNIYKEKLKEIQSAQEFADSYELGLSFYVKKDYSSAVEPLKAAIQANDTRAYFLLGRTYYHLKNFDKSIKYLELARNYDVSAYYCLGIVYQFEYRKLSDAINNFNQYLYNNDKSKKYAGLAHYQLANIYEVADTNKETSKSEAIYHYAQAALEGNQDSYQKLIIFNNHIQKDFGNSHKNQALLNESNYWLAHVSNRLLKDATLQASIQAPIEEIELQKIKNLFQEAADNNFLKAQFELAQLLVEYNDVDRAKSYYNAVIKNSQVDEESLFIKSCTALATLHHANTLKGNINQTQADLTQAILLCKQAIEKARQEDEYRAAEKLLDTIKYQLITGLLYEALRCHTKLEGNKVGYNINTDVCVPYRKLLNLLNPHYENYDANQFNEELEKAERKHHDFFGTNLSDDSDSEEEINYKKISNSIKQSSLIHSHSLFKKADLPQAQKKLSEVISGEKFDTKKAILKPSFKVGKAANSNELIEQDLKELNYWKNQNKLDFGIKRISTKFVIAQYRGIHYKVSAWSQAERQKHRKLDEIGKPIFSSAVYEMAGASYVEEPKQNIQAALIEHAIRLKEKLMSLQDPQPYSVPFNHYGNETFYEFPSIRHYLHDLHAKDYDKFHALLEQNAKQIEQTGDPIISEFDIKITKEPFVSTGDIPLHALKYAYGVKPYEGHHHERLRPRWNKEGRAERPYSGKLYLSLHPVSDYLKNGPFHMVSENYLGNVRMDSTLGEMIMQERETSFLAYMEEERIVYTHVAKYPSFKGDYKEIYAGKYGLDKNLYDLFKNAVTKFPPHSDGMDMIKILLGEYLCHYHQVRLVEQAHFITEQQGKVLVYLDQFGNFSLHLPPCTPPTTGKGRENLNELRQQRHQRPLILESDEVQEPPNKKMRK